MKAVQVELSEGGFIYLSKENKEANEKLAAEMDKIATKINKTFSEGDNMKCLQLYRYYFALKDAGIAVYGKEVVKSKRRLSSDFNKYLKDLYAELKPKKKK